MLRPVCAKTSVTSGTLIISFFKISAVFKDSFKDELIGISAVIQSEPSFNCGKNSVPKNFPENKVTATNEIEIIKLNLLFLNVNLKPFNTILSQKFTNGLFFSLTFLFKSKCVKTGTKVKVKIKAPNNAKPRVNAKGENILPSTFWNEKIGINEVIIINFEKKIAFPKPVPVCLIQPAFASLLNLSGPYFLAL